MQGYLSCQHFLFTFRPSLEARAAKATAAAVIQAPAERPRRNSMDFGALALGSRKCSGGNHVSACLTMLPCKRLVQGRRGFGKSGTFRCRNGAADTCFAAALGRQVIMTAYPASRCVP